MAEVVMSRHYFSVPFIIGAARLAREAKALEDGYDGMDNNYLQENNMPHRGLVVAAVISATSCLEACINELFSDADQPNLETLKPLPQSVRETMAGLWSLDVPRTAKYSILQKYNIAYFIITSRKLDMSRNPAQDADSLIELRNALVHYEPSWQQHGINDIRIVHKFEKKFRRKISRENKLTGGPNPFDPDKLLGYGCAKWSVETSIAFIDKFCADVGIVPPYDYLRKMLSC
jgi:hypothetical protein